MRKIKPEKVKTGEAGGSVSEVTRGLSLSGNQFCSRPVGPRYMPTGVKSWTLQACLRSAERQGLRELIAPGLSVLPGEWNL